jgi:ferredoxin
VPARVVPVEVWHTASVGIDLWLSAIALGAAQVWVLMTDEEAPDYRRAVAAQMQVAQAILAGLGLAGEHFAIVDAAGLGVDADVAFPAGPATAVEATRPVRRAEPGLLGLDAALRAPAAATVARAATFAVQPDKRTTLDLAIDHLRQVAPRVPDAIPLPAPASPFGSLVVDRDACTLCLACVGACPEAALADNADRPQLRFFEKNCVQCGLCASTCPENAIRLEPRLLLADGGKARSEARVLHEAEPFCCVRCGKPFGTLRAIELMIAKLGSHPMFQGAAGARLKMCSDCRVIDLHSAADEVRIDQIPR